MSEVINLNNLSGISSKLLADLAKHNNAFKTAEFLEDLIEEPKIAIVLQNLDEYCNERSIVGYHCTNAIPEEIAIVGLTCRSGEEIRSAFLKKHGKLFTVQELEIINEAWEKEFGSRVKTIRDNRIYFNFTTKEIGRSGSELLLNYFGGEQVYWPIYRLKSISNKIKNIGIPMILKCVLVPKNLKTYSKYAFGRIAISSYHSMLNPHAHRHDEDGNQNVNVKPENIEIIYFNREIEYSKI